MPDQPSARKNDLVVEELPDEVLVYDLENHRAHCLNRTAAAVWRACNGRRTVDELAAHAAGALGAELDPDAVWMALDQLGSARLLESMPRPRAVSRRKVLRALVLAPAVVSILAPRAAQAASCSPRGGPCNKKADCCPGLNCNSVLGHKFCG